MIKNLKKRIKIFENPIFAHMEKQQLPIGRQDFRTLREDNCIYVDKTQLIHKLCTEGKAYFMSRPRRFGKSLLLSTLQELFRGNKAVFKGLWIEDKWNWSKKHPVLHISFLSVPYETYGLEDGIRIYLLRLYKENKVRPNKNLNLDNLDIKTLLTDLIKKLHDKHGQVVILIDEYDKPIIDHLEFNKLDQAKANQEILGIFYAALKDMDAYIRLLFITGISKFTRVSLFSKLNNLTDLTLNPLYSTMLGYTQQELESYFDAYITDTLNFLPQYTRQDLLEKIRLWYNGFSWDGVNRLYNPFGILLFFNNFDFQSFWFQTGTPKFLVKKIEEQGFYLLENVEADVNFLNQYSLDNIELTSLLFQTGYLTIKEKRGDDELTLSYPNREVRTAMYTFLIDDMGHTKGGGGVTVRHLRKAFMNNDLTQVQTILAALFGGLTYDVYIHQTIEQVEGFYHGLIHILFKCLGLYIQSEVHTLKGRADAVVETPAHIYFLEFKINSDAATAFQQIIDKQYAIPYAADSRLKIGIGINFNTKSRQLDDWKKEAL